MSVSLSPLFNGYQSFLTTGLPNNGGFIYTYIAGSTTPKATFTTNSGGIANANPIPLGADGRPPQEIWLTDGFAYKFVLTDALLVTLPSSTFDNMVGTPSSLATSTGTTLVNGTWYGGVVATVAQLATSIGTTLIGFIQNITGAITRSLQDKLSDQINFFDFLTAAQKADVLAGTATLDLVVPLQAARDYIASLAYPKKLVFSGGRYAYSASPNWAIQNAEIVAEGTVYFRNIGTGNSVLIDGGAVTGGVYGLKFGATNKFIIEGAAGSLNGVYARAILQGCHLGFQINGAGTTYSGFRVDFAVCAKFDIVCSSNVQGYAWYSLPTNGIYLNKRGAGELCSFCTFNTPIVEHVSAAGIYSDWAFGNVFIGGTSEGNQIGIQHTVNSFTNAFYGMDMESNTAHDIYDVGHDNEYLSVKTNKQITFDLTAHNNRVIGGYHAAILMTAATFNNLLSSFTYNKNNDASMITDTPNKNRRRDLTNFAQSNIENVPLFQTGLTITASPYTYTNTSSNEVDVSFTGTGINSVSLVRATVVTAMYAGPGCIRLSPGDGAQLSYTAGSQIGTLFSR